jgi:SAM-dependent methyltransferase
VYRRDRDALVRCPSCGSLFSNPRYERDELAELYRREYYDPAVGGEQRRWALQEDAATLHRTVLGLLRRRYPQLDRPGARLLDFGCGLGFFLAEAKKMGMQCQGVEFSDVAAVHARERLGLEVTTGDESALEGLPDGSFDLVTSFEVIEHVLDPVRTTRLLAAKLRPPGGTAGGRGGVLAYSYPNLRCWRRALEGGRWFNFRNPTHLNFFSPRAMRTMLEGAGLGNVRRAVFWGGRPGWGVLRNVPQYACRLLNIGSDTRVLAEKTIADFGFRNAD